MTPEQFIDHIDASIARAIRGESKVTPEILNIRGFSTATMRHLYNNLASKVKGFMEVGAYAGGVLVSAAHGNTETNVIGWENESQDFGAPTVFKELTENIQLAEPAPKLISGDFFNFDDKKSIKSLYGTMDIVIYDGEHSYESQRDAVVELRKYTAPLALLCVDDASWEPVSKGTQDGLELISDTHFVVKEWKLRGDKPNDDDVWHNGVDLYLLQKK